MKSLRLVLAALAVLWTVQASGLAQGRRARQFDQVNLQLHGQVLDFTHNHGADRRIWSPALCEWRDLYVYLPPGYDPEQSYPLVLFLHGFLQDEVNFLENPVPQLDQAIACGEMPPVIVAAPDGSIKGRPTVHHSYSLFANTKVGNYEDYLLVDVWNFLMENFPIRPEPEAHALVGVSFGGGAAFRVAIEHRDNFKTVVGVFPAVNMRWVDCHGRYRGKFDPCCWGWREKTRPNEVVGKYVGGLVKIRAGTLMDRMIPRRGSEAIEEMSRLNPIELIDRTDLKEGELNMFIAYAGRDQFNIDAQVESFLYLAQDRGLTVGVAYDPKGRHDTATGRRLFPDVVAWLAPLLEPYAPPLALDCDKDPSFPELPPPSPD
jgi:S-formylglutathione hydrolase FrmB